VIQTYTNVLPLPIVSEINDLIKQRGWNYGWKSNNNVEFGHWNVNFVEAMRENGIDTSDQLTGPLARAWTYITTAHLPNHTLLRCYANGHTYGVEGYPHTDSIRPADKTLILYMNDGWQKNWGGETLIYDGDDIVRAEIPRMNKGLLFPGSMLHTSRGVTRVCPTLRVSVMFKVVHNDDVDPVRNRVQQFLESVGANDVPHNKATLAIHLLRTYDLLKNANQSEDVCLAGSLHSIFGTNIFTNKVLTLDDRSKVEEIAGPKATALIEQFSSLERPTILEQNVNNPDYADLCAIECANLAEQYSLGKYPNLNALWRKLNKKN
jgi:hypothetical protein